MEDDYRVSLHSEDRKYIYHYADFVREHELVVLGIGILGGTATEEYVAQFEQWEECYKARGVQLANAYVGRLSGSLCAALRLYSRDEDFYPKTLFVKKMVAKGVVMGQLDQERLDGLVEKYLY